MKEKPSDDVFVFILEHLDECSDIGVRELARKWYIMKETNEKCEKCGENHPVSKYGATTKNGKKYVSVEVGDLLLEWSSDDLPSLGGLAALVAMVLKEQWCLKHQNTRLHERLAGINKDIT